MLTRALRGMVERFGLQGQRLDDVAAGAVMKHSSQWNLTRESVLGSGLAAETPGLDLQRACGTSLEAAILLGNKIALGQIDCAIAGGVDTVSDPPVVFPEELSAAAAARAIAARARAERIAPWLGLAPAAFAPGAARDRGAAHRTVDGREHRTHGEDLGHRPRGAGPARARKATRRPPPPTRPASTRIWCASISGLAQDNNIRSRHEPREARQAAAGVRYARRRHA